MHEEVFKTFHLISFLLELWLSPFAQCNYRKNSGKKEYSAAEKCVWFHWCGLKSQNVAGFPSIMHVQKDYIYFISNISISKLGKMVLNRSVEEKQFLETNKKCSKQKLWRLSRSYSYLPLKNIHQHWFWVVNLCSWWFLQTNQAPNRGFIYLGNAAWLSIWGKNLCLSFHDDLIKLRTKESSVQLYWVSFRPSFPASLLSFR